MKREWQTMILIKTLDILLRNTYKMTNKTKFLGVIANADSSILKVQLEHGFKIESLDLDNGLTLIANLEDLDRFEAMNKLGINSCINQAEQKIFFVTNSIEYEPDKKQEMISKFNVELENDYLRRIFRLIRLFKMGNICVPFKYYFKDIEPPRSFIRTDMILTVLNEPFSLADSEIPDLQQFIKDTHLPFKDSYVQLAFENFELSYDTIILNLSFLALMISLEVLFNPGKDEVT